MKAHRIDMSQKSPFMKRGLAPYGADKESAISKERVQNTTLILHSALLILDFEFLILIDRLPSHFAGTLGEGRGVLDSDKVGSAAVTCELYILRVFRVEGHILLLDVE